MNTNVWYFFFFFSCRSHEAENLYECGLCSFKFRSWEAFDKHQKAHHGTGRTNWSCWALTSYGQVFSAISNSPSPSPSSSGDSSSTQTPTKSAASDQCGYCGQEFPKSGRALDVHGGFFVTENDWKERIQHLQAVHYFRECNPSKKFYRIQHFRQHVKHSHAGRSGSWSGMLENFCMIEEGPTVI